MFFEDFQDGCHFGYRNRTILAILNFYVTPMPPIKCQSDVGFGRICCSFEVFQAGHHGGHLGYWNGKILAILNLLVTSMPPVKFRLNPTYSLG